MLNRTNNRTIRGAFGDDIEGWVGKIIVLFPTMVDIRGKMGPALRVRIPPPKQASTATASAADSSTPKPADAELRQSTELATIREAARRRAGR